MCVYVRAHLRASVSVSACKYVCMNECIHDVCIQISVYGCMHVGLYLCNVYILYECMHGCTLCMYVRVYVSTNVRKKVSTCVHM